MSRGGTPRRARRGTLRAAAVPFFKTISQTPYRYGILPTCHPRQRVLPWVMDTAPTTIGDIMPVRKKTKPTLVPDPKPATRGRPKQLKLTLDGELEKRLDALVPKVSESAAAQEFGIKVDRTLVARVALLRGLSEMEGLGGRAAPPPAMKGPKKEKKVPASLPSADASPDYDDEGMVIPPDGWRGWAESEKLPGGHESTHDYYSENGWTRYYGSSPSKTGNEVIVFYWCSDPAKQDLDLFAPELKLQETPWGPGHILPYGWEGPVTS